MKLFRLILAVLLSIVSSNIYCQVDQIFMPDSLKDKSLEELYARFFSNKEDSLNFSLYGHATIKKHRSIGTYQEWGFYYMASLDPRNRYINYYDSVVKYGSRVKNYELVCFAYHNKGKYYSKKRNFKRALDNYILAYNVASKNKDSSMLSSIQISLGLMHERAGNYGESLKNIRGSYLYKKSRLKEAIIDTTNASFLNNYLNNLNLLSNSYRLNKRYDSAIYIINEVYRITPKDEVYEKFLNKARFDMSEIHYDKKEYKPALDSVNLSLLTFTQNNNLKNIAYAYYLKGMSLVALNESEKGLMNLKRMDSIFNVTNDLHPDLRPGFVELINNYKRGNKVNEQLYYVKQLLKFDSITNNNKYYLTNNIVNNIDKPALLKEKEILKDKISKWEQQKKINILGLFALISSFILFLIFQVKRYRKKQSQLHLYYQTKFDDLLKAYKPSQKSPVQTKEVEDKFELDESTVNILYNRLLSFESKLGFTNSNLTASNLSKELGSNTSYLGKVIRIKYDKNFREYINDLRIEYALERLRSDRKFKQFSVVAIAQEVGYKNSPPFARSFKEKTGLKPSDFLQKLNS